MYAKALLWKSEAGRGDSELVDHGAATKLALTAVHKMYAKVEQIEINEEQKLMVLDRTGGGLVNVYGISLNSPPAVHQQDCELLVSELLYGIKEFAVVTIENKVYISGGFDTGEGCTTNALIMFDGKEREWRLLSGMAKARCGHTMAHWRKGLLVTGGDIDGKQKLTTTCEFYDIERDKWKAFDFLPEPRSSHTCVVHQDNLYVSGGYDKLQQPQHNLWICEHNTFKWSTLDDDYPIMLPYCMSKHAMVSHCDSIYLIGGVCKDKDDTVKASSKIISFKPHISYMGSGSFSQSIEHSKYDRVSPWTYHDKLLPEPLYNFAAIPTGSKILLLGGYTGKGRNEHLVIYDIEHSTIRTQAMTKEQLPTSCECAVIRMRGRTLSHQLVQRNWPLW